MIARGIKSGQEWTDEARTQAQAIYSQVLQLSETHPNVNIINIDEYTVMGDITPTYEPAQEF